jgi:hypothetical protein
MAFARVIMVLTEGLSRPSRRRTRASNMTMMIRAESDAWPLAKEKATWATKPWWPKWSWEIRRPVKDVQTANNEIEVEALICATVDQREAWGCSAKC